MAFFIGYQVEGCFSSVKVQKSSIQEQGRVCWGHCEPFGRIQIPQVIMDLSFMYKAYCDEAKAAFLCLVQKKKVADSFESSTSGGDGGHSPAG